MEGWIKLHRRLLDWEWYDDVNTFRLFIHCMLKANHKPRKYRGKLIPAGTFLTSRELLSSETGLTPRQVRTSLNRLKTTNELTIKSTRQGTVIQVVKYNDYQGSDQRNDQQATNKRPTNDQRTTSNKNDNNYNNEKNDKNTHLGESENNFDSYKEPSMKVADVLEISPEEVDNIQNDFYTWYKLYDKDKGKQQAQREWSNLNEKERAKCLEVVQDYVQKTTKRFRKDPQNYLMNKAFNDEIIDQTKNDSKNGKSKFAESIEQAKRNFDQYEKDGWDF